MTQRSRRKLSSKGWSRLAPGTHERTVMKKECGSKCFLGPTGESCFPICAKGTCKINTKGIYAAYVRAKEYGSKLTKRSSTKRSSTKRSSTKRKRISTKRSSTNKGHRHTKKVYNRIAARAKKMLKKLGFGPNLK